MSKKQQENQERPRGRTNREIESEVVAADPKSGAVRPAGKPDSTTDTIRPRKANQRTFDAVENKTAVGRAKRNQILETAIPAKKTKGPKPNPLAVDTN